MRNVLNRLSIGKKIVGLVTITLVIMVAAALHSYLRIRLANRAVVDLTETLDPVTDCVDNIEAAALEEELYLERVQRMAGERPLEAAQIAAETALYRAKLAEVDAQVGQAQAILARGIANTASKNEAVALARVDTALQGVASQHRMLHQQGTKLLETATAGRQTSLSMLRDNVESQQDEFDSALDGVRNRIEEVEQSSGRALESVESGLLRLAAENFLLAMLAFLAGVLVASSITRRLVRPIHTLRDSAKAIEGGDLGVQVIVSSADEIGDLSKSFNSMVRELRVKEQIKSTFGKYLDPRIVEKLIAEDGQAAEGQRQVMTVFFSDVQGFSNLGEMLTPAGLVNVMNEYFSLATEPIVRHQGVIDKYIGDAVMAFWGPPFTDSGSHARLACAATLEQFDKIEELKRRLPEITGMRKAVPPVNVRIGLCTGEVLVGTVGSTVSKSFTVMGDTVNTASRLEGANKQYGTRVLISEETQRLAQEWFETREIDRIKVVGKSEPVRVFELMGAKGALSDARFELKHFFESALQAYQERDWQRAQATFEQCLRMEPADKPSEVYLGRIRTLINTPPAQDWDGVWQLSSK